MTAELDDAKIQKLESELDPEIDRKSTRLNSSHLVISYAVFCLKKKKEESRRHVFRRPRAGGRLYNHGLHLVPQRRPLDSSRRPNDTGHSRLSHVSTHRSRYTLR